MATLSLFEVVRYCDRLLRTGEFNDYEGAVNGLQVENRGAVTRVAAAVDASLATVRLALDAGADLLVVHHGLFWSRTHPWTGRQYELLRCLLDHNLAVYSSHLPLDAHPRLGNNALLCAALGLKRLRPFFFAKEQCLGFQTNTRIARAELVKRLRRAVRGEVKLLAGGPEFCRRIGVVGGGGRSGHVRHRRRTALDVHPGGAAPIKRSLRRPLRDRNLRRAGAGGGVAAKIWIAVDVFGSPQWIVTGGLSAWPERALSSALVAP